MKEKQNAFGGSIMLSRAELRLIKGGLERVDEDGGIGEGDDDYANKCAKKGNACGTKISCCAGNYCVGNKCWPSNPS